MKAKIVKSGTTGNGDGRGRNATGGLVLTRDELAVVLKVSVRTVDRMATAEDIPLMDMGEDLVRFYLPDVLEALRSGKQKHGRQATQPEGLGSSKFEVGSVKCGSATECTGNTAGKTQGGKR